MIVRWRAAIVALALLVAGMPLQARGIGPPGASDCMSCHPAAARAETPVPPLGGVDPAIVVTAVRDFRDGRRPATVMDRIAKGFSDDEIAAIAAFVTRVP